MKTGGIVGMEVEVLMTPVSFGLILAGACAIATVTSAVVMQMTRSVGTIVVSTVAAVVGMADVTVVVEPTRLFSFPIFSSY